MGQMWPLAPVYSLVYDFDREEILAQSPLPPTTREDMVELSRVFPRTLGAALGVELQHVVVGEDHFITVSPPLEDLGLEGEEGLPHPLQRPGAAGQWGAGLRF